MQLTESKIRQIARRVLKELFTRKSGIGLSNFVPDSEVRLDDFGSSDGADGMDFGESEEKLDEESEDESEEE